MTDNHNFVVETALDSLEDNLSIDCSWIQVTSPFSQYPHLASFRNFTDEIHHEMSRIDLNNYFIEQIVGLGNKIVVPNLNMKGAHILTVFKKAGFHSLIAVPITTYKVMGIMGVAFRKKRSFSKDYINLIALVSNLVGMALSKNMMIENTLSQDFSRQIDSLPEIPDIREVIEDKKGLVFEEEALDDKMFSVIEEQETLDNKPVSVDEEEGLDDKKVSVVEEEALDDKRVSVAEEALEDKKVLVTEEALEDEIVSVVEEYEALKDRLVVEQGTHTEDNNEIFQKHVRIMTAFRRSHSNQLG